MSNTLFYKRFSIMWPAGLAAFAVVIWLSLPLQIAPVPGGIVDHQAAGSALEVNRIQAAWNGAGLTAQARIAMAADLVFIVIYGLGAWYGGLWLAGHDQAKLKRLGWLVVGAAALFLVADLTETLAQLVQLARERGSNGLAAVAAGAQPVKLVAWTVTFIGIIAGLVVRRISRPLG